MNLSIENRALHSNCPVDCIIRKKLRLPQPPDLPQDDFTLPSFLGNPLTPSSHIRSAGIQGARHARFKIPLSDLNLTHKPQLGLFPSSKDPDDDISFGTHSSDESANGILRPHVFYKRLCEVFLGSQDMGRTLDLSVMGSFEELHRTLASWFGIERFDDLTCVVYEDSAGAVKRIGDESFSEFVMKAKRLTILMGACGYDDARKPITGLGTAGRAIESSKQTGVTSIFA
nr:auxin response factor 10 [Tanacetum cinerariifolium]